MFSFKCLPLRVTSARAFVISAALGIPSRCDAFFKVSSAYMPDLACQSASGFFTNVREASPITKEKSAHFLFEDERVSPKNAAKKVTKEQNHGVSCTNRDSVLPNKGALVQQCKYVQVSCKV